MEVYCDEELDLRNGFPSAEMACESKHCEDVGLNVYLPDDVLSILADCACEYITDQLAFSLLSDQHREVMVRKLYNQANNASSRGRKFGPGSPHVSLYELDNIVDYFVTWSHIRIGGGANFVTEESSSFSSLSFYCKNCHSLIITQNEVDSPHYHGGYGPAFLANFVYNCHHSPDEGYETQFTTGVYRVCDVTCLRCNSKVGKKYIEARDPSNYFKVGKILLEQTLLTMPKCCDNRKNIESPYPQPGHYFCSRESGVSCFCSVCLDVVKRTTAKAILALTNNNLDPSLTLKLLTLLVEERHVLSGGSVDEDPPHIHLPHQTDQFDPAAAASSSPSRISAKVGSVLARLGLTTSSPTSSSPTSRDGPVTPVGSSRNLITLGNSTEEPSFKQSSNHCIPRLKPDSIEYLSRSIGARLAMFPENQNWFNILKFVSDLVQTTNANHGILLSRQTIIESLVSHCGVMSFHSASLLLSRLAGQNSEDRRAALAGIRQKSNLTAEEIASLCSMNSVVATASPIQHRWFTPYD